MEVENAKKYKLNVLYYIAAFLLPGTFLFNLYNSNRVHSHLNFLHILIVAGIISLAGLLIYVIFRLSANTAEGALILSLFFWLFFWMFEEILGALANVFNSLTSAVLIVLLLMHLVIPVVLIRIFKPPLVKFRPVFIVLAASLMALFVINFIPGLNHMITLQTARAEVEKAEEGSEPFSIKSSFIVDPTLPDPDIYWLHLDGMMSLGTVECFWGESQEQLRKELADRGFVIYEDAQLNAGYTSAALPALLSPMFYDSFLGTRLDEVKMELRDSRTSTLHEELTKAGLSFYDDIVPHYELFSALIAAGYEIEVRDTLVHGNIPSTFYHLTIERSYVPEQDRWNEVILSAGDLPRLLTLTTPLNIPSAVVPTTTVVRQPSIDSESSARFVFDAMYDTHISRVWEHDPNLTHHDFKNIDAYPLAYKQISENMLILIDTVLEENPNAVIVLQSDHGFHINDTQQHLLDQGVPLEMVLELSLSVFSAVRIPSQYGELTEPIAPLNISRELVNRFVGENYELLLKDDEGIPLKREDGSVNDFTDIFDRSGVLEFISARVQNFSYVTTSHDIKGSVELITDEDESLRIIGWFFEEGIPTENQNIYVELMNADGDVKTYDSIRIVRQDIADSFDEQSYAYSGFRAEIPIAELIGWDDFIGAIIIENDGELSKWESRIILSQSETEMMSGFEGYISDRVQNFVSLPESYGIRGNFDVFKIEDGKLRIYGWFFEEGIPTENQNIYIELKNAKEDVRTFRTMMMLRQDVADHFGNPNYVNSGFIAEILLWELEYQDELIVSIVIENDGVLHRWEQYGTFNLIEMLQED